MNKIVLIDGSNLLHRALHIPAIFELSYNGIKTGAVNTVLKSLIKIVKNFKDYPIVFWDRGHSERRVKLFPNYKYRDDKAQAQAAGQVEQEDLNYLDEYRKQRAIINKILEFLSVPALLLSQTEADDMIGYIARKHPQHVSFVLSEDADYLQLLDVVDVYMPIKNQYYSEQPFSVDAINYSRSEKTKLRKLIELGYDSVRHYLLAKSMMGDGSDNIVGVKGIGEVWGQKLARKILADPEYLTKLAEIPDDKMGAFERKLKNGIDDFNLALDLVDLEKEVFSKEQINQIYAGITLALNHETDMINLIGTLSQYGLQKVIGSIQEYINTLTRVKSAIKNILLKDLVI